jgi:peptidoglycan/xylan/chitin deacetylase (PgdA/CDA1 family)
MAWLKENFRVVSLQEGLHALKAKRREHHVAICFDDGYQGVYSQAYPILQDYQIPATVFINGAFMHRREVHLRLKLEWIADHVPWDQLTRCLPDLHSQRSLIELNRMQISPATATTIDQLCLASGGEQLNHLYLSEETLRLMDPSLMAVGSHGYSHRWLAHLDYAEQERELLSGRDAIQHLPHAIPYVAIPFGTPQSYNTDTLELLKRHFHGILLSAYGGINQRFRVKNGIAHAYRNSVSSDKPDLLPLLWLNHTTTWITG